MKAILKNINNTDIVETGGLYFLVIENQGVRMGDELKFDSGSEELGDIYRTEDGNGTIIAEPFPYEWEFKA